MNCPGCGVELKRHEWAQPMKVGDKTVRPASFCSDCCHGRLWRGGDPAALERLVGGTLDPAEQARLDDVLGPATTFEPLAETARETLRSLGEAHGFEIPESAR